MEHPFGGALPVGRIGTDLQELAGEGQFGFVDVEVSDELLSECQAALREVGLAGGEAAELGVDAVAFLLKRALSDLFVGQRVVEVCELPFGFVPALFDHLASRRDLVGGRDGIERDLSKQIVEGIEPLWRSLAPC